MLPKKYGWLAKEPGPKMLVSALAEYGTFETPGAANNPKILGWAREIGGDVAKVYTADSIPWCGLFVALCAKRAGKALPASPLWARAWATWGEKSPKAALGDVLVFVRNGGGHVGIYVGEDAAAYHVLGGNQSDGVTIARIAKGRCIAARRSYTVAPPASVRAVQMADSGPLSTNEA